MKRLLLMSWLTLLSGWTFAQKPAPVAHTAITKPVKLQFGPLGSDQLQAIQGVGQALLAAKHSESGDADYRLLSQHISAIQEKAAQAQREALRIDSSKGVITAGVSDNTPLQVDGQTAQPPMQAEQELRALVQASVPERVTMEKRFEQSGTGRQPLLRSLRLIQLKDMEAAASRSERLPLAGLLKQTSKTLPAEASLTSMPEASAEPTFATFAKHRPLPRTKRHP